MSLQDTVVDEMSYTQEQASYDYIDMRYTMHTQSYRQDWMVVGKTYGL